MKRWDRCHREATHLIHLMTPKRFLKPTRAIAFHVTIPTANPLKSQCAPFVLPNTVSVFSISLLIPVCNCICETYNPTLRACLENDDNVFHSDICDHMYHSTCILDWLERRSNRDCPCCRQPLVSEDAVWETVKVARKVQKTQGKKVKRKNRRWRFASLTSETNVASSSNGAPEREASNESNPRREGQHSLSTSPPSTGDESGHDLTTTENGECGHDDDSANRSLQDQSGFHQSTLEKTQEHAIAMGDQSPLDEEMGISNVEVPLFATAGDELTEGCSVAGDADEGKRE